MADEAHYDPLVDAHDNWRDKEHKLWLLEWDNVQRIMKPIVGSGGRVLELACGSGFYTYDILKWGASSVLAVDISSSMIQAAKDRPAAAAAGNKVSFLHADCGSQSVFPGAPFDVVFAAWLLSNAPDKAAMVNMFKTACVNLKPTGTFVAVTASASEDPKSYFDQEQKQTALLGLPVAREFVQDLEDGMSYRVNVRGPEGEDQFFVGYRLRKSVYESAAREAGFEKVTWIDLRQPEEFDKATDPSTIPPEIRKQLEYPDFGLLVLRK